MKGYYQSEQEIVAHVKNALGVGQHETLSTIECQIMDIADDIAYSVYDLEDTMEAGIVNPLDFFSVDDSTLEDIVKEMGKRGSGDKSKRDVLDKLSEVFAPILQDADTRAPYKLSGGTIDDEMLRHRRVFVGRTYRESLLHAKNPLIRRQYLETLIQESVESISVEPDHDRGFMSKIVIAPQIRFRIDCMKLFNFFKVINSRELRVFHHRSKKIVEFLFDTLCEGGGSKLLHEHDRERLAQYPDLNSKERRRIVTDIIASLTDRDAVRLYLKLNPVGESSMFGYP